MLLTKTNGNTPSVRSIFNDLFDMDNFFSSNIVNREIMPNVPAVNVKEDENEFQVQVAAPGFEKQDLNISLENEVLTISAEKKDEKDEESENFKRREFNYTSFARTFKLPTTVKEEEIKAEYKDGILTLNIPKKEESKKLLKKKISVN